MTKKAYWQAVRYGFFFAAFLVWFSKDVLHGLANWNWVWILVDVIGFITVGILIYVSRPFGPVEQSNL